MSRTLRIALAHLSPRVGDLNHNRRALSAAMVKAARLGADWVVTPELCLTGYGFRRRLGTDWIRPAATDPDAAAFRRLARRLGLTLFLGHPEQEPATSKLHNAVLVLSARGVVSGHRKISVVPGYTEGWSSPGAAARTRLVDGVRVGMMVCADAYRSNVAAALMQDGAQILLSPSAWPPRPHGPDRSWRRRSLETGVPLAVCNRTGVEDDFSFRDGETALFDRGRQLARFTSARSALVAFDWEFHRRSILRSRWSVKSA